MDASYCCKRCGYHTDRKSNYRHHLTRKVPCKVIHENVDVAALLEELEHGLCKKPSSPRSQFVCSTCSATYTSRQGLHKHSKVHTQDQSDRIAALEHLVTNLITKYEHHGTDQQTVINNIQNIQVVNVNIPSNFGQESIDHIMSDKPFLTDCVLRLGTGIANLIQRIHFDEAHPMNHNIRNPKKKQKTIELMKDGQWQLCDQSSFLKDAINKGYRILYSHYFSEHEADDFEDRHDHIRSYFEKIGNSVSGIQTHNEFWQLRKDMLVMIHNNTLYLMQKVIQ
jgi:hypothetical protein